MDSHSVPLAELVRSGLGESLHFGSAVVVQRDGSAAHELGDVHAPMYPRSASKPAQAVGMLHAGLRLDDEADLALAAASHSGETEHVERIRALLHRHDLTESALRCPADWPLNEAARDALIGAGSPQQPITMNCSGKHAAMLATCQQRGWPTDSYLDRSHPLQQVLAEVVTKLSGEPIAVTSVDGCGAPLFAFSLLGLARLFATLTTAEVGTPERRVADAVRAHPWWMSGTGREDLELMHAVPGLLAKTGFEGVLAMALPDGRAVAIKTSDGTTRARLPVAVSALRALGVSGSELDRLAEQPVFGGTEKVGVVRAMPALFG